MRILFENGRKQLVRLDERLESESLIVLDNGRDWFYPKTVREGVEKMLTRDWDETLDAFVRLVEEMDNETSAG